jgi:hypothetical protein
MRDSYGAFMLVYKQMARYFWLEKKRKEGAKGEKVHQFD